MKNSIYQNSALILACLVVSAWPLSAQTSYGSIVGTVSDASGAGIPGGAVTLTNLGTAERRPAVTDGDGNYRLVNLIPGSYRLQIETGGFKRYNREPIQVEIQATLRIDATMQVGDVTETVSVSAETPLLQTQTGTLGQVIEGRVVQEMPLNGRNVLNLIALVPGVVPQGATSGSPLGNQAGGTYTNNTGWGNYQIGGGMGNQSAFYLDGAPTNTNNANSVGLVPSQDAIQEFRVETNSVSPEFGRFSGGVVNMVTKSGTNEYHGSVYEYLRNRVLNANDFFNNRSGVPRASFTQNQYGVTAGGPAIKDKFFVFFAWDGFALRNGLPTLTTVPTAAMRSGDFTGLPQIYDPYTTCGLQGTTACPAGQSTRVPFPDNKIPANRIDPTAKVLMNIWGQPNLPGNVNNFAGNTNLGGNQNQYTARGDYNFSEKHRLFLRYTYWDGNSLPSDPFNKNFGGLKTLYGANGFVAGDTYTLNPTTIVDFRVSYLRALHAFRPQQTGTDLSQYGPAWAKLAAQFSLPVAPLPAVTGFAGFSGVYIQSVNNHYSFNGSVTKILGRHTLKLGGEARRYDWNFVQSNTAAGSFNFNNVFTATNPLSPGNTGYSFASYLLGTPSSGSAAGAAFTAQRQYYQGYYFSDSFRATNKLTLNLGIRMDIVGSFTENYDRIAVFLPDAVDPLGQQAGRNLRGQMALVNSPAHPDRHQLSYNPLVAPRLGFAYSVTPNAVLRGGYGLSWVSSEQINYSMAPFQSPVNAATTTMVTSANGGLTPLDTLSNPFPNGVIQPPGHDIARLRAFEGQSFRAPIAGQPTPYVQQWNLEVQRQFGHGFVVNAGYAGSKATHLSFSQLAINMLSEQDMARGSALLAPVNNPFYGAIPTSAGELGRLTATAGQLLRPYPQFLNLSDAAAQKGSSTYNALQVRLVKRFNAGGMVQASYTWAKLLSDTETLTSWLEAGHPVGGVQNPSNLRLEKSLASFHVPQRLVLSYVLDLPVGKGKKFLGGVSGIGDKVLSGWGLNGVSTFQIGYPLALTTSNNLTNSLGGGSRPNVISTDKSIDGTAQSRIGKWFNTAAFSQPASFTYGNESRTDPNLRGHGIANFDFTVSKQTPITESVKLEFRTEFFNLFNRVQFSDPGTSLGNPQFGIVSASMNQPRLIQLGLRLLF